MPHLVTLGGAQKSLRHAMELLASRGHDVQVFSVRASRDDPASPGARRSPDQRASRTSSVSCNDVEVREARTLQETIANARASLGDKRPNVVIVPAEDVAQRPLREALRWGRPVVLMCQTPATLPFGDGAAFPCDSRTELLRRANLVLATSRFLADYICDAAGILARFVSLPVAGPMGGIDLDAPWSSRCGALMINPSTIKGLPIFLDVARALPDQLFLTVPTWATQARDLCELRKLPNVAVAEPTTDIYSLLRRSRVVLVPSLWLENVPLIISEAIFAGVPVLASSVGGIPEAMRGTGACIPVRRGAWTAGADGSVRATAPPQDASSWIWHTQRLMASEPDWISSRDTAWRAAVQSLRDSDITPLEEHLQRVASR